jgi:hypothetical protein
LPFFINRADFVAGPHLSRKRCQISIFLAIMFLLFAVNYVMALFGHFHWAVTIVMNQFLSLCTKGIYTTLLMDVHIMSIRWNHQAADYNTNESRRTYLKYVRNFIHVD